MTYTPYAAKALVEHEFDTGHLHVWVTFSKPMTRSSDPLADPVVYDVMPPLTKWILDCDAVQIDIVDSAWLDEYTLLLTSDTLAASPSTVFLTYDGPDPDLRTVWEKQWYPWGAILSTDIESYLRPSFVNRGDPNANDFTHATMTADDAWHDMDLSAIVPAGAKSVYLKLTVVATTTQRYVIFRKNGNSNEYAAPTVRTQVANAVNDASFIVALDANRRVEYKCSNVAWTGIYVLVLGWFM